MRRLVISGLVTFAADQLSKLAVIRLVGLRERGEVDVIDPLGRESGRQLWPAIE